jgi:hypothetical protein
MWTFAIGVGQVGTATQIPFTCTCLPSTPRYNAPSHLDAHRQTKRGLKFAIKGYEELAVEEHHQSRLDKPIIGLLLYLARR